MTEVEKIADDLMEYVEERRNATGEPDYADLAEAMADRLLSDKGKVELAKTLLRQVGRSEDAEKIQ